MLYLVEIENFLSVRDAQAIDLRISDRIEDKFHRFAPIFPGASTRVPKTISIFGANASGKTNVLRALNFIFSFVRNPNVRAVGSPGMERFNDETSKNRSVRLAVEFGGPMQFPPDYNPEESAQQASQSTLQDSLVNPGMFGTYRYELELGVRSGIIYGVISEQLKQRPDGRGRWNRIFDRNNTAPAKGSKLFPIHGYRHLLNTLDPATSIISNFSQFNHPGALIFKRAADSIVTYLEVNSLIDDAVIDMIGKDERLLSSLNLDLSRIDLGLEQMRVDTSQNVSLAKFRHRNLEVEMPWMLQSNGTRSFIRVYPVIQKALETGGVAVIDELDSAIHPNVLPEILRWFQDPGRNPKDAQIWFTGQSTELLDELTPEEVLFAEKDRQGRTSLYLASEIARRDDNLRKKYISGAYGAIPQIG